MMEEQPKTLSKGSLLEIKLGPTKKIHNNVVLQLQKIIEATVCSSPPKLLLSDGIYCEKSVILSTAKEKFTKNPVCEKSILSCDVLHTSKNGFQVLVLMNYEIIYEHFPDYIGFPEPLSNGQRTNVDSIDCTIRKPSMIKHEELLETQKISPVQTPLNPNLSSPHKISNFFLKKQTGPCEDLMATVKKEEPISQVVNENIVLPKSPQQKRARIELPDDDIYLPINLLTLHTSSWIVKARIIKKSEIVTFTRKACKEEQGKVMNLTLMDNSGIIQGTFWNSEAENYHKNQKEKKVYAFAGGELKPKSLYNKTNNLVEIHFNRMSEIIAEVDTGDIPMNTYNFTQIRSVMDMNVGKIIDIMVFIEEEMPVETIQLKSGDSKSKKTIQVADESNYLIEVCLWGDIAGAEKIKKGIIIILRSMVVRDYYGKHLSSSYNTSIEDQLPDIQQLNTQIDWKQAKISTGDLPKPINDKRGPWNTSILTSLLEVEKIGEDMLQNPTATPVYQNCWGYFMFASSRSLTYDSCPNDSCKKKIVKNHEQDWYCEKCMMSVNGPDPSYMGSIKIADDTNYVWATINNEKVGQAILGKSGQEIKELRGGDDEDNIEEYNSYQKSQYLNEFNLRLMLKINTFNNEQKIQYFVVSASRPEENYKASVKSLLDTIEEFDRKAVKA